MKAIFGLSTQLLVTDFMPLCNCKVRVLLVSDRFSPLGDYTLQKDDL